MKNQQSSEEIGQKAVNPSGWLDKDGSYLSDEKRSRMIEAGKAEGASLGEQVFGQIAQAHSTPLYVGQEVTGPKGEKLVVTEHVYSLVRAWQVQVNVDPEDPYEHGVSDTLMACAEQLQIALRQS